LGNVAYGSGDLLVAHFLDLLSVQEDAAPGLEDAVDAFNQRGLSRTVRSHQAQDLCISHNNIEIIEDLVAVITKCEVFDSDIYQLASS
jgi:hypothetical protein